MVTATVPQDVDLSWEVVSAPIPDTNSVVLWIWNPETGEKMVDELMTREELGRFFAELNATEKEPMVPFEPSDELTQKMLASHGIVE